MALSVGLGILTFNVFDTGREADLRGCLNSLDLDEPDEAVLLTNGSTDGTAELVVELAEGLKLRGIAELDCPREIWYGNTRLIDELSAYDLIVLSADDLVYDEGWLGQLVRFMDAAPDDVALCSAYMEPVWDWNRPIQTVAAGGVTGLERASVCGSSWAFRAKDWREWMGPFDQIMPGEDLKVCERIHNRGGRMVALDLCEHVGEERSAWGNKSHLTATPLDPDWKRIYDRDRNSVAS